MDQFKSRDQSLYGVSSLLPGKPTTWKIKGFFPFLAIGCIMPLVDFASDIATAGMCSRIKYLFKISSRRGHASKRNEEYRLTHLS